MNNKSTSNINSDCPISAPAAANYLGIKLGTLYQYCHRRVIKHFKMNGRILRFKKSDLDDFIFNETNRVKTVSEIDLESDLKLLDK